MHLTLRSRALFLGHVPREPPLGASEQGTPPILRGTPWRVPGGRGQMGPEQTVLRWQQGPEEGQAGYERDPWGPPANSHSPGTAVTSRSKAALLPTPGPQLGPAPQGGQSGPGQGPPCALLLPGTTTLSSAPGFRWAAPRCSSLGPWRAAGQRRTWCVSVSLA